MKRIRHLVGRVLKGSTWKNSGPQRLSSLIYLFEGK